MKIALVGLGYWGPNYARIISELPHDNLSWCVDLDESSLKEIKEKYPQVNTSTDYRKAAESNEVDAVIIATPSSTHFEIAKYFLDHGIHTLVEKPFTKRVEDAEELISIARKKQLTLMAGHVYVFNPAVRAIKRIIDTGELGDVYYMKSDRLGVGPIRKEDSALWDLATHDVSIALFLLGHDIKRISAEGVDYMQDGIEDFVSLSLQFANKVFVNICASWYTPEKIRKIIVGGSNGMLVFDDVNKDEALKFYKRKVDLKKLNTTPTYKDHQDIISVGEVTVIELENVEPLKEQVRHFIDSITGKKQPIVSGEDGQRVVRVLHLAEQFLKKQKKEALCLD